MARALVTEPLAPREPDAVAELAPNLTPPPGNPRFPLFDALRAIAALSVFLGHTVTGLYTFGAHPGRFLTAAQLAYQGVGVFFLISGFLLYRPFVVARRGGAPVRVGDYARRRVLRIVPAYWMALSVCILFGLAPGVSAGNWWVFYGFGQIYSNHDLGLGIGVAWTLCIEVSFYAALPLFAALAARLSRRPGSLRPDAVLLGLLCAGSLVYRAHFDSLADAAQLSTLPGTFSWFALGMGLALLSVRAGSDGRARGRPRLPRAWPELSWAAAVLLSVAEYELIRAPSSLASHLLTHLLYGVVALFVLLPAVFGEDDGGPVRRLLASRAAAWVGLISYAFYLYHSVLIAELAKLHGLAPRYPLVLLGALALTLAVAAASYYLLERPLMRWGRTRRPRAH